MEINTDTYGATGLPKFGSGALDQGRDGAITEVAGAFNQLMSTVKKFTHSGNEAALAQFGLSLQQAWYPAVTAVAGKAVINA